MIKITFKNLEKSQIASDIVHERFEVLAEKFPDLNTHNVEFFLSMENSRAKTGKDVFGVKVIISGEKYGGIIVEKKNVNLYIALDNLMFVILESLNRKGDKARVKRRNISRKQKSLITTDIARFPA
jgi:ribosome-associated translation inhibitor RaiA